MGGLQDIPPGFPPPPVARTGWPWSQAYQGDNGPDDSCEWPRVTIVTPSWNQGRFLEETIRSVLLQGYPNLEYIVMDAGSTDESVAIIRKYERYLTYWTSQPDAGQSDAINRGWRLGTGEIVAWVNADDLYEPGIVFDAVSYLRNCATAGMVCGTVRTVSQDDSREFLRTEVAKPRSLATALKLGASPGTTAAFIRRQALDQVGYVDTNLHYWIDPELWIRIALKWDLGHVPMPWYRFRIHPASKTSSAIGSFHAETLACLERLYRRADLPISVLKTKPDAMSLAYLRLAGAFANNGKEVAAKRWYFQAFSEYPLHSARLCLKREFLRGLGEYFFANSELWHAAIRYWRLQKERGELDL
jgi:glycosyltransferase involved in cell wall biosynthesis